MSNRKRGSKLSTVISETLEQRQLLSASLSVSQPLMVFNAVNGSASVTEYLGLTNTGNQPLTLSSSAFSVVNDPSSPTQDRAQFGVPNAGSAPATLAPGATFVADIVYYANRVARQSAFLDLSTNDPVNPTQVITMHGIGTAGRGGSNQPSLARILRAYQIPTIVGEGLNDSNEATDSVYPNPPDPSSQEVVAQRWVKATSGPVTVQTLASFTADATEPYTLGYYTAGSPDDRSELFYTPSSESQSVYVHTQGSTAFDPGATAFGFYFVSNIKDNGTNRIGYQEDVFNTFDSTNNRKFRFFPYETPSGAVVPNAYVMTSTEYNAPIGYDFVNIVAIVRNVMPAASGPVMGVQRTNALPGSSTMIFSRIQNHNASTGDHVHDTDSVKINNTGQSALTISAYGLPTGWQLVSPPAFPLSVGAGSSYTFTLKFIATTKPTTPYNETNAGSYPNGGGVYSGNFSLVSNAVVNSPTVQIPLTGYWQQSSENENEPNLQVQTNLMARYGTLISSTQSVNLSEPSMTSATYYGEETVSAYWQAADTARPVTVQQLSAFHTQNQSGTVYYYTQNSSGSVTTNKLYTTYKLDGQTVFPTTDGANAVPKAQFSTGSTFGWRLDNEYSEDAKNALKTGNGHHMRFYPIRSADTSLVSNTYLVALDYSNTPENFDFQDVVLVISNIKPANGATAPTDVYATNNGSGAVVQWAPVTAANGLKGYNVYRSTTQLGTYSLVASQIAGTVYQDTTVSNGAVAYYKVSAVDSTGESQKVSAIYNGGSNTGGGGSPNNGVITGHVFKDSNGNGVFDSGEPVLSGWGVFIDANNNGVFDAGTDTRVLSDSTGSYSFTGLAAGTYHLVEITPSGFTRTVPVNSTYTVTVAANATVSGKDWGVTQTTSNGAIAGIVFDDVNGDGVKGSTEPVLTGWGVFLDTNADGVFNGSDVRAISDSNGNYSFTALAAGTYYLSQGAVTGWHRISPATVPYAVTVTAGQTSTVNFAEAQGPTAASLIATPTALFATSLDSIKKKLADLLPV